MTHEDFVREARAVLSFVEPGDLRLSTHDSHGAFTGKPYHAHYVYAENDRLSFTSGETDDAIRAGLAAFAEQLAGPRPDDAIGLGM